MYRSIANLFMENTKNTVENVNEVINVENGSAMKKEGLMHEAENDLKQEIMNEVYNPEHESAMKEGTKMVEINLNGECRMAAFARGLNRGVNEKSVALLTERMVAKGYRKAEQVQVIKAEEALGQNPHLELVDMGGEPIKAEDAALYYLVPDGQHRIFAADRANRQLPEDKRIVVPAVEVELAEGETLAEYIYDINSTKEEWGTADYAQSAQLVQQNPLLERYAALMKSKSNPEGLTLTVLNRMYCDNEKAIAGADFRALCEGRTTKGRKAKSVIPVYNIERGNAILAVCTDLGLSHRDMNRRFVMDTFKEFEIKYDRQVALDTFSMADKAEVEAMRGKRGSLDEEKFTAYLRSLAEQVKKLNETVTDAA